MDELPVTWSRVVRVWWAFFWRMSLLSLAFGVILLAVGFIAALALGLTTAQTESIDDSRWLQLVFFALGAVVTLIVTRQVLIQKWGDFRIVLVKRSHSEYERRPTPQ